MVEALEGKFYTRDKDGHVVDLNYKPPAPPPPSPRDVMLIQSGAPIVRMTEIIKLVCYHFNVALADLRSARRDRQLVLARQAACYLARKYTSLSFPYIGRSIGRRDHTTVIHGNKMVERDKGKFQPALSYCIADIHRARQPVEAADDTP